MRGMGCRQAARQATTGAGHSPIAGRSTSDLENHKLQAGALGGRFTRVEPRRRARALVLGPLADLPPMNC